MKKTLMKSKNILTKGIFLKWLILFVFLMFFAYVINFDTISNKISAVNVFYYGDLGEKLCGGKVSPKEKSSFFNLSRENCPKQGIVSVSIIGGRTGNQMWEYASVWAVARRTGLDPYIPRCIRIKLDQIFEQLTVPAFEEIAHCPVEINTFVKSLEDWLFTNQSIILPRYTLQPELVLTWVQDIVQEFRLRKKLRDKAQQILKSFVKSLPPKDYTFVGVHVRRTDYIPYIQRKYAMTPAEPQFFYNAMSHFQRRYPNVIFIYISDDPLWCLKQFGHLQDVFIASHKNKNTPAIDLAIMASCNHSIFDYGTFGEWGAILAGGETVYYNMSANRGKGVGEILKNWHLMT